MRSYRTRSEEETIAAGEEIARLLPPGAIVLLIGNLGAGKTTLAKGIVKGLGAAEPESVSSPTFTLVHEYGEDPRVYHIDLYRLEEPREVATLGLEELWDSGAMLLIEWGERFPNIWPQQRVEIHLQYLGMDEREIEVRFLSADQ
jgi:tRNA threonylcarbamoyladenosine biosynthesis protein TsaE